MVRPRDVNATEFKAKCLSLLDEVHEHGGEMVITKHGKPVARLVSVGARRASLRGAWKGTVRIRGDIVHVDWTSEFGAAR
jgi:prevent-host-death family protein